MDITQLCNIRKKNTYKVIVFRYIFFLTALLLLMFGAYTYSNYQKEYDEKSERKVANTADRIVLQVDERFNNLRQYYVTRADNDAIKWFLENDMQYSDYSGYKAVYDDMGSEGIFTDYWKGIALINFETGWCLSNKGIFQIDDAYNKDIITYIYEQNTNGIEKNYWIYDKNTDISVDKLDRNYSLTVETQGLNFIMRLPFSSYNTHALFIANINMDTWKTWINELLENDEEIVVLDSQGELVYATNDGLAEECAMLYDFENSDGRIKINGGSYITASKTSDILGWNYYVLYNVKNDREIMGKSAVIFCILFLWVVAGVFLISHLIYSPVDILMKNVLGVDAGKKEIVGNEFEYLAGSYKNLKEDKRALENLLHQQYDKLEELFELRLIHGDVSSDELNEYLDNFRLKTCQYFETAVVILNLGDEEVQSMVNEDAICLKILQEMPEELLKMSWMRPIYNASAIFVIFSDDDKEALIERVHQFNEKMKEYVERICGYHILMGVSAAHRNYHHIRSAYRESINALMSGGDDGCHFYLSNVSAHDNNYNISFEHDIKSAVNNMDNESCYHIIDEFGIFLRDKVSYDMISLYTVRMVDAILLTALETKIDLEQVYPEGINKLYREIVQINEYSRIRRYLKSRLIDPLLAERKRLLENDSYKIMAQIEKKIAESKGNISVTECADALGVSTSYIWKVLKMESGKSFSVYQDEYKLEEAKRLLLQTDMSVVEIAVELNYTNAQNFIRFFSKKTGITPGKFRKL